MQKKWKIKDIHPQEQARLSDALGIHPVVAQLLLNRGIEEVETARDFLKAGPSGVLDPFLLKDMDIAVKRIQKAAKNKERVIVFGDYDVDGVTSSTVLTKTLNKLGIEVINHIPHRIDDGYGLNHKIADFAKAKGVSLLITVDCGMTASAEVDTINAQGVDVIVVDHHMPSDHHTPRAHAIVNPKQPGCAYPFKDLASVGLAAKLTQALLGKFDASVLDLVALGTVADIVPLHGENRIFVKAGLARMNKTKNVGLSALLEVTQLTKKPITAFHIGFILGPRINAAGRMDTAHTSLDLFLSEDKQEALSLAKQLDQLNSTRQKMQREVVAEAMEIVEQEINFNSEKIIVVSKEGWHRGVLGIVSSRITDRFYRPSIVISLEDGVGTASARSIDGFHIQEALASCADCLEEFGGHQGAAGLTIKKENIDPFKSLINQYAEKSLTIQELLPTVVIDCEVPLEEISLQLANIVDSMQPFGEANPTPVFCARELTVKGRPAILGKETLKFWVTDGHVSISAIGFGMAKYEALVQPEAKVDLAFELIIDDWNKAPQPQLRLKDIRPSQSCQPECS